MRTYFMLHYDTRDSAMLLRDAELGRVVKALYAYCCDGALPENLKGAGALFFNQLRTQFDRDLAQYEKKCGTNRENAQKRWGTDKRKLTAEDEDLLALQQRLRREKGLSAI